MTRWEALVRFDDEIRDAATKLIPFGSEWVDKLGDAFFALNEDRKYLPNIVAGLTEEAEWLAQKAAHASALGWVAKFYSTADGEETTEEALAILIEAQALRYELVKDGDGTIRATRNSSISYFRSNANIMRFGRFFRKTASS
jgi:hypothetical protein